MNYKMLLQDENEDLNLRYELAMGRIHEIATEHTMKEPQGAYFRWVSEFLVMLEELLLKVEKDELKDLSLEELQALNKRLYEDILPEIYSFSYANPTYATRILGDRYGKLLGVLYTELRGIIVYAHEYRLYQITILLELFVEVYNYFIELDEYSYKDSKRAMYDYVSDYSDFFADYSVREQLDPGLSFATDIVMNSDLTDLRYLYQYGEYITNNEIETAKFLNQLSEEEVRAMATTYTEGLKKGFESNRIDMSSKSSIVIRYRIGFERMVRYAIENFRAMGLEPILYRASVSVINKRQHLKIGYHSTSPNLQYDYDHRFDHALYLDKSYKERRLSALRKAYEKRKELAAGFAGPTCIEVFGEEIYTPVVKREALALTERQQKIQLAYDTEAAILSNEYIDRSKISFTIIAYPLPEIGKDYESIFKDTVKVNTLDYKLYQEIQQKMIDALDMGDSVHVVGKGNNKTDLTVNLFKLSNANKESIFENCVADVNIPVGEVFTSPMLEHTNGTLHVPKVFLNGLEYRNLKLEFKDGFIVDYSCSNYEEQAQGKAFIKENLLYNHETLPIGEFAIGTNTTAYMMGRKYQIENKLPILIAEKTGPHFAVGDTCYRMSEDVKVYNPDGKEIVARENSVSALRKNEPEKAYFNCHTDITIPFDELEAITVNCPNGEKIDIIRDTRFVLQGTEELNKAFDIK